VLTKNTYKQVFVATCKFCEIPSEICKTSKSAARVASPLDYFGDDRGANIIFKLELLQPL